ncbi:MAG: DUF998 domain-containing protein [Candidatus Micrarchaeota archaeon]|nr:DUF998 domain-containing protein [Candidatus Micrarchaeota archaeon]
MAKGKVKNSSRTAGILIGLAAIEIILFVLIAQHLYPNYSLNDNYISDLGVGGTAIIFNTAIQAFGIIILIAAYLIYKSNRRYIALAFAISAIGAIGVGTFPETTGAPHIISAMIVFGTIGITALGFAKVFKKPLVYYTVAVGLLSIFIVLLSFLNMTGHTIVIGGLGHGGVEEILFYNEIIWALVVGFCLYTKRI